MYLVTGGTGLIGSRVVRDLVREGEHVVVYDLFPVDNLLKRLLSEQERSVVKIAQGDVTDLPNLLHLVKENSIERIIHLASLLLSASTANPSLAIKVNCQGTANIFETARLLELKKVVWASSVNVFGAREKHPEEYIPNDAPHYPDGVYAACKSFNETLAVHYTEQYGVDISAARYSLVYGIGQSGVGTNAIIMRELVEKPATGKPGSVPFGDDAIGWLYVNDAARATILMSKVARTKTKAFTVSGEVRPIREVADYVRSLLPGTDITLLPGRLRTGSRYDTKPLEEEIGYTPQWSVERGIRDAINMVRQEHGLPLA